MYRWIPDAVAGLIVFIGLCVGAKKGLVNQLFALLGTIVALVGAYFLCKYFVNFIDKIFSVKAKLIEVLEPLFKHEALQVAYSGDSTSLGNALQDAGIKLPNFLVIVLTSMIGDGVEGTIAHNIASIFADYICLVAGFIILFILLKIVLKILNKALTSVTKLPVIHQFDKLLGACLGACYALIIVAVVLYGISFLPDSIPYVSIAKESITNSYVVSYIYQFDVVNRLINLLIAKK